MKSYLNNLDLKNLAKQRLENAITKNMLSQKKGSIHRHQEYWNNGKGSTIGCISELNDIDEIENMFGIPKQLLRIQNHIFLFLNEEKAKQFSNDFIETIPVGKDLHYVWKKYFIWLLAEVKHSKMDRLQHIPLAKDTIQLAVDTLKEMLTNEIPAKKLTGIIKSLNANRSIVGRAADSGSIQPENAGWELAAAHCAIESALDTSYIPYVLFEGGPPEMWEFLADQLLSFIKLGKPTQNTYFY